jgi:hypothetical protein
VLTQSENVHLIDKILNEGYITPPADYKWHGHYQIVLSEDDRLKVLNDLIRARDTLSNDRSISDKEKHYAKQNVIMWTRCMREKPMSYEEYKSTQTYFDLRSISHDEFHKFIFDHDVAGKGNNEKAWYHDFNLYLEYDEEHIANLYIELFHKSDKLLDLYSKEKLEQGFWAIMGSSLEGSVHDLIWESELDIGIREKLIYSMYHLYEKLFAIEPLDTSSNMWWDSLAYDYYEGGPRDPQNNKDDKQIQEAMFHTLKKILDLKSEACQWAALHGLGHLRHPDTAAVIEGFIRTNKKLTDDEISYARACISGDIM